MRRAARGDRPAAGYRARRRPARRPAGAPDPRAAPPGRPRSRRCDQTCRDHGRCGARPPSTAPQRGPPARHGRAKTAQTRPRRAGNPQAPRPARHPGRAPIPARRQSRALQPRRSAHRQARRCAAATAAIVCDRLCMSAPSTIMTSSLSPRLKADTPADMACLGRCHAPIKSRRDVPDQRRATQRKPVRPNGRQRESESTRRQPEPPFEAGRHARIQTASLTGALAADPDPRAGDGFRARRFLASVRDRP